MNFETSAKPWRCCVEDPSELGKKVLCMHKGDFYVAYRFEDVYIPMPFADHPHSKHLCKPEKWQEIDFPEPFTGYVRLVLDDIAGESFTIEKVKKHHPEIYHSMVDSMKKILGSRIDWDAVPN